MSKFIGDVSAYAYAVSKGYTGTEEEFAELMASYADVGQTAVDAKDAAVAAKTAAETAANTATNKASEATTAAQTATTKAGEASTSASTATSAKDTAVSAASTATTKATEATTAAATATSAATTATTAKDDAVSAKTAAQTAQTGAETAAASVSASAEQIATNAEDISQLKSEITDKVDTADMLKAFPTDTASGSVASFSDGANVPVKSLIVNIDPVQSGSGDPSPTNVRPISGWSEANVVVSGKNLFDSNFSDYTKPYNCYICPIKLENGKRYKLKAELVGTTITGASFGLVKSGNRYEEFAGPYYVVGANGDARDFSITIDDTFTAPKLIAYVSGENQFNEVLSNYNVMLMPYEQADYEPYSGQSITIALGQTVYGGTLDVLSGELVIDRAMVDMGTLTWAGNGPDSVYTPMLKNKLIGGDNCVCSALAKVAQGIPVSSMSDATFKTYANSVDVAVKLSGITSQNAQTMLSGFQFVYPLAAPLTIQLAPHEVRSLLGSNNVWSDAGEVTAEYRADPTLYIQRLTEPDADMVADSNITSGQYFMVGNTLYKATANIASGATISPNVNCTRKSLSEALNELNA